MPVSYTHLIPIFMLFPTWIAKKIWSHENQEAYIDLYEDYAELNWNDRKVHIKKGELDIKIPKPQPFWYATYILKIPQYRIVLVSSVTVSYTHLDVYKRQG